MNKDDTSTNSQTAATSARLISLGLAVCMLLFMAGCGKTEPENSEGASDSGAATASRDSSSSDDLQANGDKTTVRLLDAGAQPRTELRYKFQANQSEKMIMEMSMAMAMEIGEQKQPETQVTPTRTTMTIDSKEISPEGDVRYEFKVEQVEVLPGPGADPATVNAMKQMMNSMVGLSGSATVTSRGFTKDADVKIPAGINPQMEQAMENVNKSMDQMSAPLPVEPVGRGARWLVTMPVETSGLKITQTVTYSLSEIQGDKVKCDLKIKQSALPQEMDVPGAAPGTKMLLESLTSSGEGTIEMQMTNLVPTSHIDMTTTNLVSANNQKIKSTARIGIKIHP